MRGLARDDDVKGRRQLVLPRNDANNIESTATSVRRGGGIERERLISRWKPMVIDVSVCRYCKAQHAMGAPDRSR